MVDRTARVVSSLVLALLCGVAFAALMQHSETTIAVPPVGEKTPLSGLEYRARFVASIDSVVLELASAETADPVIAEWTFAGSNTDGQAHRVEISVRLLDEGGSQIGQYQTRSILPAGANGRQIRLSTKMKPDVWKATKKARIFADWHS